MTRTPETTPPTAPARAAAATGPAPVKRVRIHHLRAMKERGERFAMLTAYDQFAAEIFDEAGIPVLLVGDSAANNVLGYETTLPVTVDELLPLVRAVSRGARARAGRRRPAVRRLPVLARAGAGHRGPVHEGGWRARGQAGGRRATSCRTSRRSSQAGIPVMAHIGFTPQSEHGLGGYRVQGRGEAGDELVKRRARPAGGRRVRRRAGDGARPMSPSGSPPSW